MRTTGEVLDKYLAQKCAIQMLKVWGWECRGGGFVVPAGDKRDVEKSEFIG